MNIAKALLYVSLIIFIIVFAGFANIWALNTLFPSLSIPYTFWTWLASIILFANIVNFNRGK